LRTQLPEAVRRFAFFLQDHRYYSLWKSLRKGPERKVAIHVETNTLTFDYDPEQDSFTVYDILYEGSDPSAELILKTDELHRALVKYTRGAP
jgi:hypothetical protein